tara:strand:- start:460 stop:978 length:519 start_codon:yes stop_codon:yes gene_type:complete
MTQRRIFKKNKSNKKFILIIIILFSLIFSFFLFFLNFEKKFVIISENDDIFYIVPKDKGGQKVVNIDKKSLNLKTNDIQNLSLNKPEDLKFSIQFYVNSDFSNVKDYLYNLLNSKELIYLNKDFFILAFNTEIGTNYFLLYKNFETRKSANSYCFKYLISLENCLIVDGSKL